MVVVRGPGCLDGHVFNRVHTRRALVVFDELEKGRFDYTIRMNDTVIPSTKR